MVRTKWYLHIRKCFRASRSHNRCPVPLPSSEPSSHPLSCLGALCNVHCSPLSSPAKLSSGWKSQGCVTTYAVQPPVSAALGLPHQDLQDIPGNLLVPLCPQHTANLTLGRGVSPPHASFTGTPPAGVKIRWISKSRGTEHL